MIKIVSKVIIECQKRDDYQEAIRWFLDHFKKYAQETNHGLAQNGGQYVQAVSEVCVLLLSIVISVLIQPDARNQISILQWLSSELSLNVLPITNRWTLS